MNGRFEKFTVSVSRIQRVIRQIENHEMEEFGLRSPHISCLYYLYATDVHTAAEIVEKCEDDKATVSRSLDFLEKNGYVVRETTDRKRYNSQISLTEKGRETAKMITGKIDCVLDEVSFDFTEEQRKILYECLGKVADRLEHIYGKLEDGETL